MEYKDIKTADELESWYAEKEDILEGYVRDYAVPFGNVYHLDSPGYVSEERWCDTLPSDRERSTFMALQNGVSTKEIIETNFSFEDTCGLVIDDSVTFSGYTQNELVDMIGREDNGEDFVITGVGAGHYVGTCKKEPSKNKSVSEKTCNARESSGRLDADRNVDRNDIAKDKEVK